MMTSKSAEEEQQDDKLVALSPPARQFVTRKLATFMEKTDGSDIHFLITAIRIVLADISARDDEEMTLTENEDKILRIADMESSKILSYTIDTNIDKLDVEHPKFIAYRSALVNMACIKNKVFEIAFRIFSKTNIIHISIPHDFLVQERSKERNIDLTKEDEDDDFIEG